MTPTMAEWSNLLARAKDAESRVQDLEFLLAMHRIEREDEPLERIRTAVAILRQVAELPEIAAVLAILRGPDR